MAAGLGKGYWLLWSSSVLANLGDGMRLVALPLLAYSISEDPLDISLVTLFSFLPGMVLGPLVGVLVDRFDRRRVVALADALRSLPILLFALVVCAGEVRLLHVYVLAAVLPVLELLEDSAARPLMAELLPERALERGNARLGSARMVAQDVLGSPAAGFLMAVSASLPFFVNGATFVGATILVLLVKRRPRSAGGDVSPAAGNGVRGKSVRAELSEGFAIIRGTPLLRAIALTSAVVNFVHVAGFSLLVVYAKENLHLRNEEYAFLFTAMVAGGVLSGWLVPRLTSRWGTRRTMVAALTALGLARGGLGSAVGLYSSLTAFFAMGAAMFTYNVAVTSYQQRVTPTAHLGRVYATTQAVSSGAVVIAALAGGALAQFTGVRAVMLTGGLAIVVSALICGWATRRETGHRSALSHTGIS
ncbi:MFS transporter [Streptomyces sp. ODS05-4]|uniref:MFS transporter n=1 Tax=Streptomyces sp. ODS05-4 TaxID=2944939 RepID=UPI00210CD883|nr:MFS transporter [Streptomyces sp. ODS05-4]